MCEEYSHLYKNLKKLENMAMGDAEGDRLAKEVEEMSCIDSTFVKTMQSAEALVSTYLENLQNRIDNAEV